MLEATAYFSSFFFFLFCFSAVSPFLCEHSMPGSASKLAAFFRFFMASFSPSTYLRSWQGPDGKRILFFSELVFCFYDTLTCAYFGQSRILALRMIPGLEFGDFFLYLS